MRTSVQIFNKNHNVVTSNSIIFTKFKLFTKGSASFCDGKCPLVFKSINFLLLCVCIGERRVVMIIHLCGIIWDNITQYICYTIIEWKWSVLSYLIIQLRYHIFFKIYMKNIKWKSWLWWFPSIKPVLWQLFISLVYSPEFLGEKSCIWSLFSQNPILVNISINIWSETLWHVSI